jgi:hypothetical protein
LHVVLVQRGRAARSYFRILALKNESARWRADPARGYRLVHVGLYYQAAIVLEQAFLNGCCNTCHRSREDRRTFWTYFGTAHFYAYEATGDRQHLDRALMGLAQVVDQSPRQWGIWILYCQALFFTGESQCSQAAARADTFTREAPESVSKEWRACAHAISAMVYFNRSAYLACRDELKAIVELMPLTTISPMEVRFMLGNIYLLLERASESALTLSRSIDSGVVLPSHAKQTLDSTEKIPRVSETSCEPLQPSLPDNTTTSVPKHHVDDVPIGMEEARDATSELPRLILNEHMDDDRQNDHHHQLHQKDEAPVVNVNYQALARDEFVVCYAIVELWPDMGFARS